MHKGRTTREAPAIIGELAHKRRLVGFLGHTKFLLVSQAPPASIFFFAKLHFEF